jgi:hypothetical protein
MKSKYGASYELTEEQLKVRWETFDISGNGGVSEEDFNKSMLIKLIFYDDHYPFEGTDALKKVWRMGFDKFMKLKYKII